MKMSSSLPSILGDHIVMLQTELQGAQHANWTSFRDRAAASIETILASVELTPTIQRASDQVHSGCQDLADELQNPAAANATVERIRESTIDALDILESVLQRSQPSEQARSLGRGW
uniref:Uncharacterized protein n=1 Tax=Rhodopseudomonas palustris (strain BisA53) TaxID=316055 RepID=Q07P28_RHOP5